MRTYSASCTNRKVGPRGDFLDEDHIHLISVLVTDGDRVAKYSVSLMEMDPEVKMIDVAPDDRPTCVTMSLREFSRIVGNLCSLGESVSIEASHIGGLSFAGYGEGLESKIVLKQTDEARERYEKYGKEDKVEARAQGATGTSTSVSFFMVLRWIRWKLG